MPKTWKSHVLLNLVLIAKADGELRPIEVLYLSRCKNRMDANHRTLADAIMRSYWEDVGSIGEVLGNEQALKDMINMAMVDGAINADEHGLITKYVDVAKISKDRVEIIMRDAIIRFNDELLEVDKENSVRLGRLVT